jgi:hypothetical protein
VHQAAKNRRSHPTDLNKHLQDQDKYRMSSVGSRSAPPRSDGGEAPSCVVDIAHLCFVVLHLFRSLSHLTQRLLASTDDIWDCDTDERGRGWVPDGEEHFFFLCSVRMHQYANPAVTADIADQGSSSQV